MVASIAERAQQQNLDSSSDLSLVALSPLFVSGSDALSSSSSPLNISPQSHVLTHNERSHDPSNPLLKRCVQCPSSSPACPSCASDETCAFITQTCDTCAFAVCRKRISPSSSLLSSGTTTSTASSTSGLATLSTLISSAGSTTTGTVPPAQQTQHPTPTPSAAPAAAESSPNIGAIVGGVVGGVLFLGVMAWTIRFIRHRRMTFLEDEPTGEVQGRADEVELGNQQHKRRKNYVTEPFVSQ